MKFSIITLFPEQILNNINYSILKRAQEKKLIEFRIIDHRKFGIGTHKTVDDKAYGGGAGMVLRVDVLKKAIDSAKLGIEGEKVVLLCPQGEVYLQKKAEEYSKIPHLILVCGHYEGFDERVRDFVDEEISIGDYVLTGGELPACVVIDSITRLIPGVLKDENATKFESHSKISGKRILEGEQYTRPEVFLKKRVPQVFLSGDPKRILEFKTKTAISKTKLKRPDLINTTGKEKH